MHYCCRCSAHFLTLSCLVLCCQIGLDLFRLIMNDKRWDGLPIVLETPCKTEAKEAAKRSKKAIAAGEMVEHSNGGNEEEDDDEDDDEEDEDGGKKRGKGKGKGKGKAVGAKAPKEKEDWVKSYSEEIAMLYGLEEGHRAAGNGVKEELPQVKEERKAVSAAGGEEEEEVDGKGKGVVVMKTEIEVDEAIVTFKKEKRKAPLKRGGKGKAKKVELDDEAVDDE